MRAYSVRHGFAWALPVLVTLVASGCGGSSEDADSGVGATASGSELTATAMAVTWTKAVDEWASFQLTTTQTVRYGKGSAWIQKTLKPGTYSCKNSTFGYDPAVGITKQCDRPTGAPDVPAGTGWEKVALQGKSFTVLADQTLRFGTGSTWVVKTLTAGRYACDTTIFVADPAPSAAKRCELANLPAGPEWEKKADQWNQFTVTADQLVRFGKGSAWVYKRMPAGTYWCQESSLGVGDPSPNIVKQCEVPTAANRTLRPLSAQSPWNTPIPLNAVYAPATDARVQRWRAIPGGDKLRPNIVNTKRIYQTSTTDQSVTIDVSVRNLDAQANGSFDRPGPVPVNLPYGAHPDQGTYDGPLAPQWSDTPDDKDASIILIDPDGQHAHEFWHAEQQNGNGTYKAVSYVKVPLNSLGVFYNGTEVSRNLNDEYNPDFTSRGWGASVAYGGAGIAGVVRKGELTAASPRHAIALSIRETDLAHPSEGQPYVYPASKDDANAASYKGTIPMGTRFAIPRSINLATLGLSPPAMKLALALQNYGGYIIDQSGGARFRIDGTEGQTDFDAINPLPNELDTIHNLMTVVSF